MSKRIRGALGCALLVGLPGAPAAAETLAEIYQLALANDPQLRAAEASYRAAQESIPLGRAGILPKINASAQFSDGDGNTKGRRALSPVFAPTSDGHSDDEGEVYTLSLTQPLFDLPAWFTFKQGYDLDRQAKAQFAADQQAVILRVTGAYFEVLRASENLATAQAELRAIGRQLEQTKERFDVGLVPITDVHESQAAYDDATVNKLEAEGALNVAFEALEVLTGKPQDRLAGLSANFAVDNPEPLDRESWVKFSQDNNFALAVAREAMAATEKNAQAKKAEHLPKVGASLTYSNSHTDGAFLRDADPTGTPPTTSKTHQPFFADAEPTVFTVSINAPIFTGGLVSAQRRQAYQQYVQAQENYLLAQRTTTQQARSQHLKVLTDAARVNARKQGITSAQSAVDATQAGYEVGTRNVVDVLLSQRTLYQAQRGYANARYDYIASMLQLRQVAGQLSPEDINRLNEALDPALNVTKAEPQ
ncbi:MAG: TolC family outer membrane protein [Porticoccaceae bacterium]